MSTSPRILVLTPWVPYPLTGACQQDRFRGLLQMKSLGYDVRVIAKIHSFQSREEIEMVFKRESIPLTLIPYVCHPSTLLLRRLPRAIRTPALFDGAALEYTDPVFERAVEDAVKDFKPDLAWIEYTLLWPLLRLMKRHRIPSIIKSSVYEPQNCIQEHGGSLLYRLKAIPKFWGEKISATESDFLFAISPVEREIYAKLGATKTGVLPLRGLSQCFRKKTHAEKEVLDVVFLSSNYNMGHNRDALEFLLTQVIPAVRESAPGKFRFHVTGSKMPEQYRTFFGEDVHAAGFVPDLDLFLSGMDIAFSPWLSGTGMQQKVFEPLCRSIPLIGTSLAGYPFTEGEEWLRVADAQSAVNALLELRAPSRRQELADAAYEKARTLFSEDVVKDLVRKAVAETLV